MVMEQQILSELPILQDGTLVRQGAVASHTTEQERSSQFVSSDCVERLSLSMCAPQTKEGRSQRIQKEKGFKEK